MQDSWCFKTIYASTKFIKAPMFVDLYSGSTQIFTYTKYHAAVPSKVDYVLNTKH